VSDEIEVELQAIRTLIDTLQPLKFEVRDRVLDYVFRTMGIAASAGATPSAAPTNPMGVPVPHMPQTTPALPQGTIVDVLTLKEQKQPTTASQMVALVAYYLAHLAPSEERRNFITVEDVEKYFVQAQFPLPGSLPQSLVHAKNAGYLDAVEKGKYRLNSVGHNLVAHKMPKEANGGTNGRRKRAPRKAPKKSSKKAKR